MSKETKEQQMGALGEEIIKQFYLSDDTLFKVDSFSMSIESDGWYDSEKDFRIHYKYFDRHLSKIIEKTIIVECKTQVLFVKQKAFTIRPKQLTKCKSVDINVFLCIPNNKSYHFTDGYAWAIRGEDLIFYNENNPLATSDGPKLLIPTTPLYIEGKLKRLFKLKEEEIKKLVALSTSSYN